MNVSYVDLLWCCKPYTELFYEMLSIEQDGEGEEDVDGSGDGGGLNVVKTKRMRDEVDGNSGNSGNNGSGNRGKVSDIDSSSGDSSNNKKSFKKVNTSTTNPDPNPNAVPVCDPLTCNCNNHSALDSKYCSICKV